MANDTKELKFDYDAKADVLYVSLGTGEPSYSEELDDLVVIDFGIYTGAPTGFQILHIKEADVRAVQVLLKESLTKLSLYNKEDIEAVLSERRQRMKSAIDSFPRRVGDLIPS